MKLQARQLVAGALSLRFEVVPGETAIGTLPEWDSLGHMRILLALEEALGRQLEPEVAAMIASIDDIERQLSAG